MKKEDEELQKKFHIVVDVVKASFLERNVNLHDIMSSLQFLKSHEGKTRVEHVFIDILESQSLHVLFFTFSGVWNYLHPGLLEFLVERFGTPSDKNIVKEYKECLEKYRHSVKLGDFVKMLRRTSTSPQVNKELSMVIGEDWRHITLQDLEDVRLQTKCDNLIFRALPNMSKDVQFQFALSNDSEKPGSNIC